MIRYLRLLLFPFSLLYGVVVICRNLLYDWGVFKSVKFEIPVICVGNLVVGGAGKTPMTEYLVRLLEGHKIAILSRGYGRSTKGFVLATAGTTAAAIGDEPMQYFNKFKHVTVAVCEDRQEGIKQLQDAHDLIILDDAFQHRKVRAGFNILLFEFQSLFHSQWLLPAGNLREPFWGYKRADVLVATKAPQQVLIGQRAICASHFNDQKPQFFSSLIYDDLMPLSVGNNLEITSTAHVFLLTGIANPSPMVAYLKELATIEKHYKFPDHYAFKKADLQQVVDDFSNAPFIEKIIVTTEKDVQRLLSGSLNDLLVNLPIYYLPIRTEINQEGKIAFDKKIVDYVASAKRNG